MFNFLKKRPAPDPTIQHTTIFSRLKEGFARIFQGQKPMDAALMEDLEDLLLSADMGVETTKNVMTLLSQRLAHQNCPEIADLQAVLKDLLLERLLPYQIPLNIETTQPFVLLLIGVNGAGKTTTIGKIAKYFQSSGKRILLAAGDTFRAAAVQQLQAWGERNHIPVIAQQAGAESAAVIYDSMQSAYAKNYDLLIADTAGRLHTQTHLMDELKKVTRIMKKVDPAAPHEVLLVLDASIGQNALIQAQAFHAAIGVTGLVITKLDGTAKGGIVFNITHTLKLPIRFIGIGEGINDLQPFDAQIFVDALFTHA
jgi:fused signal recognition particle receptor